MTLGDKNGIFSWEELGEKDGGYYFMLTDTFHHEDYNVILVKDTGDITVNGDYIQTVPHDISMAILSRINYFMARKKIHDNHSYHHNHKQEKSHKKEESKKKGK